MRTPALSARVLLVVSGFAVFAASAGAQCEPVWIPAPGAQGIGPDPFSMTMWDADGDGPIEPVLVAGGFFGEAGGQPANRIAQWDGENWSPMGSGLGSEVRWVHETLGGGLVVVGPFQTDGDGNSLLRAGRWNPSSNRFEQIGDGLPSVALAVTTQANGRLAAVGFFSGSVGNRVSEFNGTEWTGLGEGTSSTTSAITIANNGDVVVGGAFTAAGGAPASRVARWDGSSWSPLGDGTSGLVRCLLTLANGDIIVGGAFATAGGIPVGNIARWDGAQWHSMGTGANLDVYCLLELPSGEILAGGDFTSIGGVAANRVARWNGTSWSAVGDGCNALVRCFAMLPDGKVAVGGSFTQAGGQESSHFARIDFGAASTCKPDVNCDGFLDFFDYSDYVTAFETGGAIADYNGDAFVDFFDYADYVTDFEAGC